MGGPLSRASQRRFDVTLPSKGTCFFAAVCERDAELEKGGRSVCRPCAALLNGQEYPLRDPRWRNDTDSTVAWKLGLAKLQSQSAR